MNFKIWNQKKYGEWEDYKNKTGNYESADDNDAIFESSRPGRPEIKKLYKKGTKHGTWNIFRLRCFAFVVLLPAHSLLCHYVLS